MKFRMPVESELETKRSIVHQVTERGYAFLPRFRVGEPSSRILAQLGSLEKVSAYEEVHDLTLRDTAEAAKGSYSGQFGRGVFPLHSDFAHWFIPPHYLVLRCVRGSAEVKTRLVDSRPFVEKMTAAELSRALVQPRKPINGQRPLLRLFDRDRLIFRWDGLFLAPCGPHGTAAFAQAELYFAQTRMAEFCLMEPGDTLVIDNWRSLHGRSAAEKTSTRKIERAYLSTLT